MPGYRPNPKKGHGPDPPPPVTEGPRVWLHQTVNTFIYPTRPIKCWLKPQEAMQPPFDPFSHHPQRTHCYLKQKTVKALWYSPLWTVTSTNPSHFDFRRCRSLPRWTATLSGVTKSKFWLPRKILCLNCELNETGHMLSTYWGCRLRGSVWGAALLLSIWSLVCCICRSVASRTCKQERERER